MNRQQARPYVARAALFHRAALKEVGRAISSLTPAANLARREADEAPTDTAAQTREAERQGDLALHLETLLGDLGVVFEELQNVDVNLPKT